MALVMTMAEPMASKVEPLPRAEEETEAESEAEAEEAEAEQTAPKEPEPTKVAEQAEQTPAARASRSFGSFKGIVGVIAAFLVGVAGAFGIFYLWKNPQSAGGGMLSRQDGEHVCDGSGTEMGRRPPPPPPDETDAEQREMQREMAEDVIRWIRDSDGFVSEKVFLHEPAEGGPRGIYANGTFEEGEVICTVPWDLMLKPSEEWVDPEDRCGTIEALYEDMKDDKTPYGRYIKSMPRNYLPHWWSPWGKAYLRGLLGKKLPPDMMRDDHFITSVYDECDVDRENDLQSHAAVMYTARGDDELLVPFYDMINHRNGPYYNVKHQVIAKQSYQLVASRRIEEGEQLHNSYNQCGPVCQGRMHHFGTPEILVWYGFVESYPQRYMVEQVRLKFDIAEKEDGSGALEAKFAVPPSVWGVDYLKQEALRLESFEQKYGKDKDLVERVPRSEYDVIWEYHSALSNAFDLAIKSAEGITSEIVWKCDCEWWKVEDWQEAQCTFEDE